MTTLAFKTSADAQKYFDEVLEENPDFTPTEILDYGSVFIEYERGWECWDSANEENGGPFCVRGDVPIEGREKMSAYDLACECWDFLEKWMEDNNQGWDDCPYGFIDHTMGCFNTFFGKWYMECSDPL